MNDPMSDACELRRLLMGMRSACVRGENVMAWSRQNLGQPENNPVAILVAYDLQTGSYIHWVRTDPLSSERWVTQLARTLEPFLAPGCSILEVGCGEATTLCGVLNCLGNGPVNALGFDISWSRVAQGLAWLAENSVSARLFAADLFEIPLEDDSIDVVYTSHSVEPNSGLEQQAIQELLRIARRAVILVEPIYELADEPARRHMEQHGYVRGLRMCAERLGAKVIDYRLLPFTANPLNPSGILVLEKDRNAPIRGGIAWQCPLTHTPLLEQPDLMFAPEAGLAYPILRGVPLLRTQHAVVASWLRLVG